ncbi:MAG TPA: nucleoside triphosphate pyrophosphohydrolase [Actinomycetota bacterium]|nr:nucleoside triphosphate pyrophosphohydrolase [Actinomycetota bacterium]
MALYVVPLAPADTPRLTLAEWDRLRACEAVWFENPVHPLLNRLLEADVKAGPFDDEPDASRDGWALVCDPHSSRILALARRGAEVSAGEVDVPDPLTAAHTAPILRRAAASLGAVAAIMARLRSDDGCPWDVKQTHASLAVNLLEEAYEVLDEIDRGIVGQELEEELGDVLLQVAFHSRIAQQDGRFDLCDVADRLVAKLVHRHPHVFGDLEVSGAEEVLRNWDTLKAQEKQREDPFDGIPRGLPALLAAAKVQKRAEKLGFEAPPAGEAEARASDAVQRYAATGREEDLGDCLFWLVAGARARAQDPEAALRRKVARFRDSL